MVRCLSITFPSSILDLHSLHASVTVGGGQRRTADVVVGLAPLSQLKKLSLAHNHLRTVVDTRKNVLLAELRLNGNRIAEAQTKKRKLHRRGTNKKTKLHRRGTKKRKLHRRGMQK